MKTFILRRLINLVPVLLGVSLAVTLIVECIPGKPIDVLCPKGYTDEQRAEFEARHGLDKPLPVRYVRFLGGLLRGDMGVSLHSKLPVLSILADRFVPTAQLAVGALLFAVIVGVGAGVLSAARPHSWVDAGCMLLALVGVSIPVFWLGMMLMFTLTGEWSFFYPSGYQPLNLRYLALPCMALGSITAAKLARITRSSMIEAMANDYIRTARAKGVAERRVLLRHGLRNALVPIVTVIGTSLAGLLSGAVLTETVFGIPGVGREIVESIAQRDYPVLLGGIMWLAVTFVLVNLIVDVTYAAFDPRIRYD